MQLYEVKEKRPITSIKFPELRNIQRRFGWVDGKQTIFTYETKKDIF